MRWLAYKVKELLWDNPFQKWMVAALVLINGMGSIWGYYWYQNQLSETSWTEWPFVPDSPLSSTLMALAMFSLLIGRTIPLFQLIAFTAVIKYGLWAVILITDYWFRGGPVAWIEAMLWLSHLGMALEGFLYLRHLQVRVWQVTLVAAWMGLNDYMDYGRGLHPYLFMQEQWPLAVGVAVLMTLALSLAAGTRVRWFGY